MPLQASRESGWQGLALHRGPGAWLLWPLSLLYGALLGLRRLLFRQGWLRSTRMRVPVVVVGNIVAGGAGKTPTTIALVQHLVQRGWRVGVVSRGHGRRSDGVLPVEPHDSPDLTGDEPLLIRRRTGVPVWVGRRRAAAAAALLAAHPDTELIVCDDGLQHWALGSDVRLAVFDERGLGNGWLLPAGLLREPWPVRNLDHAPHVVLRQRGLGAAPRVPLPAGVPGFDASRRLGDHAIGPDGQRMSLAELGRGPVTALAAIARPQAFFDMLVAAGLRPQQTIALPDHADAGQLAAALRSVSGPVVCTEKDLVKLGDPPPGVQVWAVPLELAIDPGLFAEIDRRLGQRPA